ncbi:hypothetical protein F5Y06DRAFT_270039 [Hypoxylon sp. FL0890]|nr:hypothetical protein F5Y06DRAFT_270039 [Hypoxylon sp. FL0890]
MPVANKVSELFNVDGLVAVITGGGSGLGLYAARSLDANGAKAVYIVGRREKTLKEAASTAANGNIIPIVGDVSDKESLRQIADKVRQEQGYVNFLFANAGCSGVVHSSAVSNPDGTKRDFTVAELQQKLFEPEMSDFTKALHMNNTTVFYTIVAFLDLLDAGNRARNVPQDSQILVTGSTSGLVPHLSRSFSYAASKAAVAHFVKMLATFLGANGLRIRANTVIPDIYPTEMTATFVDRLKVFEGVEGHDGAFEGAYAMSTDKNPSGRTGSEEDFAGTVLFMASRAGAYLNGATLLTDGGKSSLLTARN